MDAEEFRRKVRGSSANHNYEIWEEGIGASRTYPSQDFLEGRFAWFHVEIFSNYTVQEPEGNPSFDSPFTFQPVMNPRLLYRLSSNATAFLDEVQILTPILI